MGFARQLYVAKVHCYGNIASLGGSRVPILLKWLGVVCGVGGEVGFGGHGEQLRVVGDFVVEIGFYIQVLCCSSSFCSSKQ